MYLFGSLRHRHQPEGASEDEAQYFMCTQTQFDEMLGDRAIQAELCDAAGLDQSHLQEMFFICSSKDANDERVIDYIDFIHKVQTQSQPVTERSLMRLENGQHHIERRLEQILNVVKSTSQLNDEQLTKSLAVSGVSPERRRTHVFAHDALNEMQGCGVGLDNMHANAGLLPPSPTSKLSKALERASESDSHLPAGSL